MIEIKDLSKSYGDKEILKNINLIINDNYNVPKLVNSRFSAIGDNKYQIVDRKGNNDTNLYNQGSTFNFDVSLYLSIKSCKVDARLFDERAT